MSVTIIEEPLLLQVYGLSGVAMGKDYAGTVFRLMDDMWKIVKGKGFRNKGKNIWIYEAGDRVFAGVEMEEDVYEAPGLEKKEVLLSRYAYYKHVGPYSLIRQAGIRMREEIARLGLKTVMPYIEVYGHWDQDETKLETELIMALA